MTDRYAVFGNPIAHSRSPWIHTRFAEQTGEDIEYSRQEVPTDGFAEAVELFQDKGGHGLNITVPFKEEAWSVADSRSPRAEACGAVNTLLFRADGGRHGDNTDGEGLVRDLRDNHRITLQNRRILVLGAGGAVRGVLELLAAEHPALLLIANRTVSRAEGLVPLCREAADADACGFDTLHDQPPFDLIINGTSTGLSGGMPDLPEGIVGARTSAYDMVYGPEPTPFMRWAAEHGAARTLDGLGMLVEQAAESFRLWRGVSPDTAPIIRDLRRAITEPDQS
ncbi:shikimate dehydrogenase [Aquisalimonas asiatica]|uniref:Shikimate dehydrogenase (NADP(+)) n=1 Tax=Aquisalimonas asiatica TaxID=406100 RepID=A0A1H8TG26_9GAMM|nr:shikimate dehydrogenase [Aquisalimonas asiatica]SEO89706.1 shikimate dehydrogenase [Aquisalimonas asiatica]